MRPRSILTKFYYIYCNFRLKYSIETLSIISSEKINIFIYFDYEREFGGNITKINDDDIKRILKLLDEKNIKATWFTVGRIFKKYPDSIEWIKRNGHEVASHSNNHIKPLYINKKDLKKDFDMFSMNAGLNEKIIGFHSPEGKWSLNQLKYLSKYNFKYDIIDNRKNNQGYVYKISSTIGKGIFRFETLGDDWDVFKNNLTKDKSLSYFINIVNELKLGQMGGIGFHPWILISRPEIWESFTHFIDYIAKNDKIQIHLLKDVLQSSIKKD